MLKTKGKTRGVSTVVGAAFIGIIVFSVIGGYFVFQGAVNSTLQQAINERNQLDVQAKTESFVLPSAYVDSSGVLWANVSNIGPQTIRMVDVIVLNSACNGLAPGSAGAVAISPSVGLNPGSKSQISTSYNYKSKAGGATVCAEIITGLGNFATVDYPPVSTGRIIVITQLSSNPIFATQSVFDTATLIGVTSNAAGKVTYNYYSGSNCTGKGTTAGIVTVTNSQVPYSSPINFSSAGAYSWNANYSGDIYNKGPVLSGCEPLTVSSSSGGPVLGALSAGAIGDLYITFGSYTYYTITSGGSCPAKSAALSGFCLQTDSSHSGPGFAIPSATVTAASKGFGFSATFTDLNQQGKDIVLDQFSLVYEDAFYGNAHQNYIPWYVVTVSSPSGGLIPINLNYQPYQLKYNASQTVYFVASNCATAAQGPNDGVCTSVSSFPACGSGTGSVGCSSGSEATVFMLANGWELKPGSYTIPTLTYGTANYGQNIPFVSTLYY